MWLSISNLRNVPNSLLLYARIIAYGEQLYEIDDSDDEYEILRSAQDTVYFQEKVKIFEKTFGIHQLQKLVSGFESERLNPTPSDLLSFKSALDEFKIRHQTLAQRIEDTYTVGNAMLDYLEKQLIIDYHLRGDQELLETEHPDLIDKAKKFLGFELYYDLSVEQSELEEGHPARGRLFEKSEQLKEQLGKILEREKKDGQS